MDNKKYFAFLSYSHADRKWASWLHRSLETYRVPSHLVGTETPVGPVPARLTPIFRDREELSSAPDLSNHPQDGEVEPLAADVRKHGDGRSLARLKIISGLPGVGLDELRQRELQRRNRRLRRPGCSAVI